METIKDAKDYLRSELEKGATCPCCSQRVQMYRRKLNSGMAYTLIAIYKHSKDFFHVKDMLRIKKFKNSHDWTLLKFWGFIESKYGNREDGNQYTGYYKITKDGIDFVLGNLLANSHIFIYNKKHYGSSNNKINIKKALGDKFNYNELIGFDE
tara:strand:- start:1016 stop:1474 length:459 start_codon:yes stop_codon:yes gene_type:complete